MSASSRMKVPQFVQQPVMVLDHPHGKTSPDLIEISYMAFCVPIAPCPITVQPQGDSAPSSPSPLYFATE